MFIIKSVFLHASVDLVFLHIHDSFQIDCISSFRDLLQFFKNSIFQNDEEILFNAKKNKKFRITPIDWLGI